MQTLEIVHLSEDLLVVDKPSGWLTIPGRSAEDRRPVLKSELEKEHGRLWVVHRLDVPVSGLVAFARTAEAHKAISRLFEARQVSKVYAAETSGERARGEVVWEMPLRRGKKRSYVADHGKPSKTRAVCLGPSERGLRWELHPETGRTHQLRVHCAQAGFPICGDVLYGSEIVREDGIALRAVRLSIPGFGDFSI
jgi:tRNA pseudouridine32 synthase/23S rRNA pseudouridine746 synthase